MTNLRIFIASPSDVTEERDIVSNIVVPELQRVFGNQGSLQLPAPIDLSVIRWETHAFPDIGEDAQDVINSEIGEFDILVGIMWKRFGASTHRAKSGTGEEFDRAYQIFKKYKRPKIMFYFRTTPFYTANSSDLLQFKKVVNFRSLLENLGVLYWEYDTPLHFERNVREHLLRQISQLTKSSDIKNQGKGVGDQKVVKKQVRKTLEQSLKIRIFMSYSHADRGTAKEMYYILKDAGYIPWIDIEQLLPGQDWDKEIEDAIKTTDLVLLLISNNWINKEGYMQKELRVALESAQRRSKNKNFILPVRLSATEPPNVLNKYQWVDYFLPDGKERLLQALTSITRKLAGYD